VTAEQIAVMDAIRSMNASLTVGIIGAFFGTDRTIVEAVMNAYDGQTACTKFEIASHGWEHETFPNFNLTDQIDRLNFTQNKVQELYGTRPVSFMAPFNLVNEDTKTACRTLGITHLSAEVDSDLPPYDDPQNGLWRFPIMPATGTISADTAYYYPTGMDKVWEDIQYQLRIYGFAVVMVHPYEFTEWIAASNTYSGILNQTYINDLKALITKVKSAGLKTVTLNEIDHYFNASAVNPCPYVPPATTGSITTSPLTSAELTTSPLTTSPLSTGIDNTSGSRTTGRITSGSMTTGRVPQGTTGDMTTGREETVYTTETVVEESVGWRYAVPLALVSVLAIVL
jgi:peptidoglycan/xylan/chitin deacetylase (PgdA/CDA1 family)